MFICSLCNNNMLVTNWNDNIIFPIVMTTIVPSRGMRGPEQVCGEHPQGMLAVHIILRSTFLFLAL